MNIIWDNQNKKLSQNGFEVQNRQKLFEEFSKKFGGEVIELSKMGSSTALNPLDLVLRVYGAGKEEFIDKMSDIYKVYVAEKTEAYIQIIVHEDYTFDNVKEKRKQFLSLCASMSENVQYQIVNS